ncbi:non classical export pathway protein [Schizosaccharomyces cryophilus OY26]|uniref:Non classical export pathway protein n=1 Tax=Schizosaccharomyces cryophilus (strain OY26 / ATCC MYA-4695 / CBS 11777 / NBRC 106824 / NRRL Y48691) TaxID=653667 RepID=S9VX18_SCHCR|nr:non classical export pathway protein [Schizosaccharomyces cryophilus OY26]EPY50505.1 non classical export pathway protein [Schizosaccharomyces cryophilus OY26]
MSPIRQYGWYQWPMRIFQLMIATIVLALAAALVDQQNNGGSPGKINFSVFVGCFSILTFFLTALGAFWPNIVGNVYLVAAYDLINLIFDITAGCCIAVAIRVHSCANRNFLESNKFTQGSGKRCRELRALCFFLWFLFGLYLVSFIMQFFLRHDGGSHTYTSRGGGRKKGSGPAVAPRPVMSAV